MTELCIFPIPGGVTFPGTVFPLHVFEPRYRDMIHHCLESGTQVAICHTRKMVSSGRPTESLQQALRSNQATYRPYSIVSAGRCELTDTTSDGRLYLDVHIEGRYRLLREKQLLPYQVYDGELFPDSEPASAAEKEQEARHNQQLKEQILERLQWLAQEQRQGSAVIRRLLASPEWQTRSPQAFSFQLFGTLRFDADSLQRLLEMNSAGQRLQYTLELLEQAGAPA